MLSVIYILVLLNLIFLIFLFFFFRRYIRRELGKVEYVRHLEKELQQLVIEVNRSAEDVTQVIEDRTQQLRGLLHQHNELQHQWKLGNEKARQQNYSMEQHQLRLRELKEDAEGALEGFQLRVLNLEERIIKSRECLGQELFQSLSGKLEEELLQGVRQELFELQQTAQNAWQDLVGQESEKYTKLLQSLQQSENSLGHTEIATDRMLAGSHLGEFDEPKNPEELRELKDSQILAPKLRADLEQYIKLGLDARIISQKTGVSLNLVEILVSVRGLADKPS